MKAIFPGSDTRPTQVGDMDPWPVTEVRKFHNIMIEFGITIDRIKPGYWSQYDIYVYKLLNFRYQYVCIFHLRITHDIHRSPIK